jgi:GAF domain-containing protein
MPKDSNYTATDFLVPDQPLGVLQNLPVGIIVTNHEGIITYHNDYVTRHFGNQSGIPVTQLLPAFPIHLLHDEQCHYPLSYTEKLRDETFFLQVSANRDEKGNLLIAVNEDDQYLQQLHETEVKKNAADLLLKSAILGTGTLEEALAEVCRIAASAMEVTRVNIWEFGAGHTSITSLVSYDSREKELRPNITLYRYQIPKYFSLFETEEIIPTKDAQHHPATEELRNGYLDVHNILSLLDVPVRISGKMIGVVCFEDTTRLREWNSGEQKFGLFISQVIALAIESSRRKKTQHELELILDEKRILLNEIHRRVRNNFSLIQDLLRTEGSRAQDDYHRDLFRDLRNRINSLDMLQRHLYQSEKVDRINFRDLILDLVAGYRATFSGRATDFITTLDQCELNVAKASISGLFVNEIMMFLLSESEKQKTKESILIRLKKFNTRVNISIQSSMSIDVRTEKERMLTSFELAEKLGSQLEIDRTKGTAYSISFEA